MPRRIHVTDRAARTKRVTTLDGPSQRRAGAVSASPPAPFDCRVQFSSAFGGRLGSPPRRIHERRPPF
eukprot:3566663-Prymnesium_polylepis.1